MSARGCQDIGGDVGECRVQVRRRAERAIDCQRSRCGNAVIKVSSRSISNRSESVKYKDATSSATIGVADFDNVQQGEHVQQRGGSQRQLGRSAESLVVSRTATQPLPLESCMSSGVRGARSAT